MAAQRQLHFLIIDDDKLLAEIHANLFNEAGYKTTVLTSSKEAASQIIALQPDCVLSDLLMPDVDGLELFKQLRKVKNIKQPTFIIISGKVFEFDRRHARDEGVDAYFTKPVNPDTFVQDVLDIINARMVVQFWGVRGTLPVPGSKSVRYGGNTNCVTLCIGKKHFLIFDAGTGIKELSNFLMKENHFPLTAKIFISHPHYDHINGIPFFVPLYMKGNNFEILGTNYGEMGIEELIGKQMDTVYFPITMNEFAANLAFRDLNEESFKMDDLDIQTILLNHPGRCLGYKVTYKGKIFCYITDNELYLENASNYISHEADRLIEFVRNADLLIIDTTYSDEEYQKKAGWGHSCVTRVVDIADKAKVKLLCLHHHDPDQTDDDIDAKLKHAQELLKFRHSETKCIAPAEGDQIII